MTLSADTLATELEALDPTDTEPVAIDRLSAAFDNYFNESTCGGASLTGDTTPAIEAMALALVGMNAPGQGFVKLQAGVIAYWGALSAIAATLWITVPPLVSTTPPPTLSGIAAALLAVGNANTAAALSKEDSCAAIAASLHTFNLGGFGVTAVPSSIPII